MTDWKELARKHEESANEYARMNYELTEVNKQLLDVAKATFGLIDKLGEYDDEVSIGNALVLLALKKQASDAIRNTEIVMDQTKGTAEDDDHADWLDQQQTIEDARHAGCP